MTCETQDAAISDESQLELTLNPDSSLLQELVDHLMTNQKPALERHTDVWERVIIQGGFDVAFMSPRLPCFLPSLLLKPLFEVFSGSEMVFANKTAQGQSC